MSQLTPAIVDMIEPRLTTQDAARAGQIDRTWRLGTARRFAVATAQDCCEAAGRGEGRALRRMLTHQPSPNARGAFEMTPLMHAAAGGHLKLARRLKDAGASALLQDCAGQSAMDWQVLREQAARLHAPAASCGASQTLETQEFLMQKAACAVTFQHGTLLATALRELRHMEQRRAQLDALAPSSPESRALLARYYDLVHLTLRKAPADSPILQQVSDYMGLPYLSDARWRDILLRLLQEPDCTPTMLRAACRAGANLNAIVGEMSLTDIILVRQWPLQTLRCLLDAGVAFEDNFYRRQKTFSCLMAAPSTAYFVEAMLALLRCGFGLGRILYEEGNREACQSIIGHLTPDTMDAMIAAGLALDGVGRGGRTVGHFAADCGWWADVTQLLPALRARGVDFNAANDQGSRPIAYLMRQQRLVDAEMLVSWELCGIDFEYSTMTRFVATPGAPGALRQIYCRDALSLAAVYNQVNVVSWLVDNRLCDSPESVRQAAAVAMRFGHVTLANRLLGCMPDGFAP